jgi:hypothetical protein
MTKSRKSEKIVEQRKATDERMVGCACGAERETDPDRLVVRETQVGFPGRQVD